MIYTVFADIKEFNAEKFLGMIECDDLIHEIKKSEIIPLSDGDYSIKNFRSEILKHIKSVSNIRLKKERCAAYLLLTVLMNNMLGAMPSVSFSQSGKPYFDKKYGIYFNLSHTSDFIAVSISDEGDVGVDVECEISPDRAAKLESRFFSELSINVRPLEVKYGLCKISEFGVAQICDAACDSNSFNIKILPIDKHHSFSARWTLYEASMKSSGGGFTSLPCLNMILLETKADLVKIITNHDEFFATTAIS